MIKLTAFITTVLLATTLNAQICKFESITPSQIEGQYLDNRDGTITDIVNGLVWAKCSVGQTIVNGECEGDPEGISSWQQALVKAEELKTIGDYEFRLPNLKELASLVERACFDPSINLEAFPSTPSAVYWTNTPDHQVNHDSIKGRIVDFRDGTEFLTEVNNERYIRLVRKVTDSEVNATQ